MAMLGLWLWVLMYGAVAGRYGHCWPWPLTAMTMKGMWPVKRGRHWPWPYRGHGHII